MILPERVLGSPSTRRISSGLAMAAELLADPVAQLAVEAVVERAPARTADHHEGQDCLALDLVRTPDHRGLGHARMRRQRRFHLHGAETMAADVEHVVDATEVPEIAVGAALGAIAGEVDAIAEA